jgi:hypothetical protein
MEENVLAHLCMEKPWKILLLFCTASQNSDMGNLMQLKNHHAFLKLELSETAILPTKSTGILLYRPLVTHLWVFSITEGVEYMTSHIVSHFIECHLFFAKETRNYIFATKFLLWNKTLWEVFNSGDSSPACHQLIGAGA